MTVAMATIGLYSLVATLLWGRFVFGIHISFAQPLVFVLAALVTAAAIGVIGFLEAVASVRYRSAWALGSALELPVWLICGFLVPLVAAARLGPADLVAAPADLGRRRGARRGARRRLAVAGHRAVPAHRRGLRRCRRRLSRRVVDSARTDATLALT